MKLGLSERKHMPALKVGRWSYPLWQIRYVRRLEEMLNSLILDDYAKEAISELHRFEKYYLPPFPLKEKTVLDLGACNGETAFFFLKHGAKKVICIEPDEERAKIILKNREKLDMNIELINDVFRPEQLNLDYDFIKVDIEGFETGLLPYAKSLKPCVIEIHGQTLKEQFETNGFQVTFGPYSKWDLFLMTNYKR